MPSVPNGFPNCLSNFCFFLFNAELVNAANIECQFEKERSCDDRLRDVEGRSCDSRAHLDVPIAEVFTSRGAPIHVSFPERYVIY